MANDIKQKIVLEGEQEYNRALAEAKRNLRTLRSELKAETAELGSNATAQQKNETRIKSLQKQIKEQEKIVKTYQAALKEVKEHYGDNEDAVAKWEVKLNDARTALANMKNSLEDVGKEFKNVESSADMATVASKSVADTLDKLSDIGGTISDSIENVFTGLLAKAKETITAIWGDIVDLAARSNNLIDLAGFWNTDVQEIQKYAGAVTEVSGTLEDLNAIVTKINAGDSKKIAELTGVSGENYTDQWEYAMAVMDAMSKMSTENRNKVAFDIFGGKQATKAFDLLNDWEKLLEHLDKYDAEKSGYGLSTEELQTMSDLYDKVNGLEESWNRLKGMAEVKLFGSLSLDLTGNAQAILDSMLKYLNAENDAERDAALDEIEKNILAMFEKAKSAIEKGIELLDKLAEDLKNSDNPTAQALGNILGGLVSALKWFTEDNMNNVVHALEILAGFWLAGRGAQLAGKIASLAANIKTIQLFKTLGNISNGGGLGGLAGAGGTATTASTISQAISQSAGGLAAAFTKITISAGIASMAVPVISALADIIAGKWPDWLPDPKKAAETEELLGTNEKSLGEKIVEASSDNSKAALHKLLGDDSAQVTPEGGKNIFQQIWDGYNQWLQDGQKWLDGMNNTLEEAQKYADELEEKVTPYTPEGGPDENWNYPDWWTMEEILEDMNRRNQESTGGNSGNTDGLSSQDAKNMTGAVNQMPAAVARALSGIRVYMNGQEVGNLVAPYVSAAIATQIGG